MALDYGLKISKAGENVLTTAEANLQFTSMYPVLKVADGLVGSVDTVGGEVLIEHNLGYVPFFMCWGKAASDGVRVLLPRLWLGAGASNIGAADVFADTTNVYISMYITGGGEANIFYYIFLEEV